ncbi:hypothetical protein ACFL6M_00710 [Candidatus Eisenbacteria bacterium]|uniref:6-bladed beta-propeller n=1 Tax=Eiseniibacteriota bacterium TaxID=2212470 RepID=A0ABV6YID1_UNCEI
MRFRISPARDQATAVLVVLLFLNVQAILADSAGQADWTGHIKVVDGVSRVLNPAQPMLAPLDVNLELLWSTGTDEEGELFGQLVDVARDSLGNTYLLDRQVLNVRVYSPSGELLGVVGREGEGPGEFRIPPAVLALPGGLIGVADLRAAKIVRFTLDGTPVGDISLEGFNPDRGGMMMLQDAAWSPMGLAVELRHGTRGEDRFVSEYMLAAATTEGEPRHTFTTRTEVREFGQPRITDRNETFERGRWALSDDGFLYVRTKRDSYEIEVYAPSGELTRVITREGITPRKRTAEEIGELESSVQLRRHGRGGRPRPQPEFDFSPHDPIVLALWAGPEGNLWVRTCAHEQDLPDGCLERIDILDAHGRFLREVRIMADAPADAERVFYVDDCVVVFGEGLGAVTDPDGQPGWKWSPEGEDSDLPAVTCFRMQLDS